MRKEDLRKREDQRKREEHWDKETEREEQPKAAEGKRTGRKKAKREKEPEKPYVKGEASDHMLAAAQKRAKHSGVRAAVAEDIIGQDQERYVIETYLRYDADDSFEQRSLRCLGRAACYEEVGEASRRIASRRPLPREIHIITRNQGILPTATSSGAASSSTTKTKALAKPLMAKGTIAKDLDEKREKDAESERRVTRATSETRNAKVPRQDKTPSPVGERIEENAESHTKGQKFGPSPFA